MTDLADEMIDDMKRIFAAMPHFFGRVPAPDTIVIPDRSMRLLARLFVASGEPFIEPFDSEARAYLAKKQRRRIRMARKKRRGYF